MVILSVCKVKMGCNTSKESVSATEKQDKEKQENGDVNKAEDNNSGKFANAITYLVQTYTSRY